MDFFAADRYKEERTVLKMLCCFGWSPIPLSFIYEIIHESMPTYKKHLASLSERGFLQLTDNTAQMSPLISHAVMAAENPSPEDESYRRLCLYLKKFLQEYDMTLSIPYVSDILIVFARALYNNVSRANNPKQKKTASFFEDWQDLMYLIHDYYSQNGVVNYADELSHLIEYPPSLKNAHSMFDKYFFTLANSMQIEPAKTEIRNQIEKTLSCISSSPDLVNAINPTCFFINYLDTLIGLYCTNLFSLFDATPELVQHQRILVAALGRLVNVIPLLQGKNQIHLPAEKFEYYKLCSKLMLSCPTLSSFSEQGNNTIKKWNNINYRIRGTAFIAILESWYIYGLHKPELQSLYNSCLVPEMDYLRSQIQKCKLLPNQTFKLCLFAYISTAMVKYCLASLGNVSCQTESSVNYTDSIKELVGRTPLPKEEYEHYILEIEKYSRYFDARTM